MPGIKEGIGCYAEKYVPLVPLTGITITFLVVAVLGLGFYCALMINAVVEAFGNLMTEKPTLLKSETKTPLSFLIMVMYILLHVYGYKCSFVETPICRRRALFIGLGFVVVFCSFVAVMLATIPEEWLEPTGLQSYVKAEHRVYGAMGFSGLQIIALVGFIIAAYKQHCFGKCMTRSRKAFYVIALLNLIHLLGYIVNLGLFYKNGKVETEMKQMKDKEEWKVYQGSATLNYLLLIALVISAYQINMCCTPFNGYEGIFLLFGGAVIGCIICAMLACEMDNAPAKRHYEHAIYPILFLLLVFTGLWLYCLHAAKPFGQYHTVWEVGCFMLGLFLLAMIVIAAVVMGVAAFAKGNPAVPKMFEGWHSLAIPAYFLVILVLFIIYGRKSGLLKRMGSWFKRAPEQVQPPVTPEPEPSEPCQLRGPESVGGVYHDSRLHPAK
ncbi:putative integral membrane protein [Babesia bovis T2Bo]|uniref:Membrane protein, putative n=1 Tax=Babesia bovis TaxID=5865 RepID=A7AUW5_BABBO|nr:putative integral membrane protein [Babesia bovis T2Bo]EDO06726.1 putative integral membrane protein [Babesia bovis T2Bo]|eukprot:XP_001610294.1 membrane protein [Babesia bovis T2Bo]